MLNVGMPVLLNRSGEQHMGVIAQSALVEGEGVYSVSLEDVVIKGVPRSELTPTTPEAVRAVLGWLARDPSLMAASSEGDEGIRLYLRSAYLQELREAADALERAEREAQVPDVPFDLGEQVAVREDDSWALGVMLGAKSLAGKTVCTVDLMGEVQGIPVERVCSLATAPSWGEGYCLGARVRFVVAGHEQDDDYRAVVCRMADATAEPAFSIMFDDGDILEDLCATDLALA